MGSAREAVDLHLHHAAGDEGDHLPEEIGVGALLNELFQSEASTSRAVHAVIDPRGARCLVLLVCLAQTLDQIGAFFWPALLPLLAPQWALSNTAAGWIADSFYGAYMLALPVLVALTDRIDPKRIYLLGVGLTVTSHLLFGLCADGFWTVLGCRALTGIGWAGT